MPLKKTLKDKTPDKQLIGSLILYGIGLLCIKYTSSAWVFYISLYFLVLATSGGLPQCL